MWPRKYRLKRPKFIALGSYNYCKLEKGVTGNTPQDQGRLPTKLPQ